MCQKLFTEALNRQGHKLNKNPMLASSTSIVCSGDIGLAAKKEPF
jgi:hypothetical protein